MVAFFIGRYWRLLRVFRSNLKYRTIKGWCPVPSEELAKQIIIGRTDNGRFS